jgi:GNAT superfamily N-acetyltransferase
MPNLTIRPATAADAVAIARLLGQLGYPTTPGAARTRLEPILAHPDYATWVAADADGTVHAFAGACVGLYYEKDGRYARLLALVTDECVRGTGAGAALADAVEAWARKRGAGAVIVNSGLHRHAAHRFYERRGYVLTGQRLVKTLDADGD